MKYDYVVNELNTLLELLEEDYADYPEFYTSKRKEKYDNKISELQQAIKILKEQEEK
jgi:hypothetical protein